MKAKKIFLLVFFIGVSGLVYYLIPEMGTSVRLKALEKLWLSEKNSLTYKAAYTLLAFAKNNYQTITRSLTTDTVNWLIEQQERDGGFAPWKGHPVGSNIYCTSVSCLALLNYKDRVPKSVFDNAYKYIINSQLKNGIWAYHEIEDGAAWGVRALAEMEKVIYNE